MRWRRRIAATATVAMLAAVAAVVLLAPAPSADGPVTAAQAREAALRWVGGGTAEPPRRDGGEWEVDIRRPDGSVIEVTVGDRLELRGFDEELGPGGAPARDEVRGPLRARAVRAALAVTGGGRAVAVEREQDGELEVDVVRRDGVRVEVEMTSALRVVEYERESPSER